MVTSEKKFVWVYTSVQAAVQSKSIWNKIIPIVFMKFQSTLQSITWTKLGLRNWNTISLSALHTNDIDEINKYLIKETPHCIYALIHFIVLTLVMLGFGGSLAMKCISLNYKERIVRSRLIDMNSFELH